MIIVTSLSPNHSNKANQQAAIDSWQQYGKCYSMNGVNENIEGFTGIEFIKTNKTMQHLYGKPLVNINAFFDNALADALIINSDIIIQLLPDLNQDGITIFSRHDYTEDINRQRSLKTDLMRSLYLLNSCIYFRRLFMPSVLAGMIIIHQ